MNQEPKVLELDNYRVLHKEDQSLWLLGKGGYGTTYKAEHKHLGRICALKVINEDLMSNNKIRRRFLQEAQAAAALSHPNIAIVHDFGESDGVFYYAMEFCSGGDLEEFSKSRGPQPWSVVKGLALQILAALREAHGKGLLHRDLKPSNIMLADHDGSVNLRLIDFGLVKVLDHHQSASTNLMLTQDGGFLGNPLTASPEQLQEDHLDERSDLFSFGVTLWYLLVGGSPFGEISTAKLVHQRLGVDDYTEMLPADLDESGRYIIGKLLQKEREHRFSSAGEVISAIESADRGAGDETIPSESVTHEEVRDSGVALGKRVDDWSEIWRIREQLYKFRYGTYYACVGLTPGVPNTTLFVPDRDYVDSAQVLAHSDNLVNVETQLLCGFYKKGVLDGEVAYACPPFSTGTFESLLHATGNLSLQNHLAVFQQVAMAVDEAVKLSIPGVELEITEVVLSLRDKTDGVPQSEDEWQQYFQQKKDERDGYVENLEFTVLPKLIDSVGTEEAMVTLGDDDLATTPLARFGGLIYRSISGMAVKQAAYLSPAAHVSTPYVSEKANHYLGEVIAAIEEPPSAMQFLMELCDFEGVRWSLDIIEATQSAKEAEKHAITRSYASMGAGGSTLVLPTPQVSQVSTSTLERDKVESVVKEKPVVDSSQTSSMATTRPPEPDVTVEDTADVTAEVKLEKEAETSPQEQEEPVASPEAAILPRKVLQKKGLIVASIVAVVLGLGGFVIYRYYQQDGQDEKKERGQASGLVDHGGAELIKVVFSDVSTGGAQLPREAIFSLQDRKDEAVASLQVAGNTAESPDFLKELFKQPSRWPLKVKLEASGFTMKPVEIQLFDFKDDKAGGKKLSQRLVLDPRPYLVIDPDVKFNGNSLSGYATLLSKYMYASDTSVDWVLAVEDGKISISLPSNQSFPFEAILSVPYMKDLPFTIVPDERPVWDLMILERAVDLYGLGSFEKLQFIPDYDQVSNASIRQTLREYLSEYTRSPSDFMGGSGKWVLPSLDGTIQADGVDRSWNTALSMEAKFRVFTQNDRSGGTEEISDSKFKEKKRLAESGDIDAQYTLGLYYLEGKMVGVNEEASTAWFKLAAERGDRAAQHNVGMAYENGRGVEVSAREAVKWYLKAADQGYPDSQMSMGLYIQLGEAVPQDYKKAEEWFLKAVAQGYAPAMFNLAVLYSDANAGMVNIEESMKLYQQAAELDHPGAFFNLAWHYENGEGGLEKDISKAVELYKKAAAQGYPNAKEAVKSLGGTLD